MNSEGGLYDKGGREKASAVANQLSESLDFCCFPRTGRRAPARETIRVSLGRQSCLELLHGNETARLNLGKRGRKGSPCD